VSSHSQHEQPNHPPNKEYRDDGPRDVNYPVACCFRFSKIEHAAMVAGARQTFFLEKRAPTTPPNWGHPANSLPLDCANRMPILAIAGLFTISQLRNSLLPAIGFNHWHKIALRRPAFGCCASRLLGLFKLLESDDDNTGYWPPLITR